MFPVRVVLGKRKSPEQQLTLENLMDYSKTSTFISNYNTVGQTLNIEGYPNQIRKIFVRQSYLDLYDLILKSWVQSQINVVTGTPGIGKSTFLIYFMLRHFYENVLEPGNHFYYFVRGKYVYCYETETNNDSYFKKKIDAETFRTTQLPSKLSFVFYDNVTTKVTDISSVTTDIVSGEFFYLSAISPQSYFFNNIYKKMGNLVTNVYYMSVWKKTEFEEAFKINIDLFKDTRELKDRLLYFQKLLSFDENQKTLNLLKKSEENKYKKITFKQKQKYIVSVSKKIFDKAQADLKTNQDIVNLTLIKQGLELKFRRSNFVGICADFKKLAAKITENEFLYADVSLERNNDVEITVGKEKFKKIEINENSKNALSETERKNYVKIVVAKKNKQNIKITFSNSDFIESYNNLIVERFENFGGVPRTVFTFDSCKNILNPEHLSFKKVASSIKSVETNGYYCISDIKWHSFAHLSTTDCLSYTINWASNLAISIVTEIEFDFADKILGVMFEHASKQSLGQMTGSLYEWRILDKFYKEKGEYIMHQYDATVGTIKTTLNLKNVKGFKLVAYSEFFKNDIMIASPEASILYHGKSCFPCIDGWTGENAFQVTTNDKHVYSPDEGTVSELKNMQTSKLLQSLGCTNFIWVVPNITIAETLLQKYPHTKAIVRACSKTVTFSEANDNLLENVGILEDKLEVINRNYNEVMDLLNEKTNLLVTKNERISELEDKLRNNKRV